MKYNLVNENFTHDYGENLLRARGVKDVKKFLRPDKSCLQDPCWLSNIAQGVELLHEILESGKPIFTVVPPISTPNTYFAIIISSRYIIYI